jgi:uncharacterized protein (TIGR03790 family)
MLADPFDRYVWGRVMGTPSPLFESNGHFDPALGVYLVSRLDGPDEETALGLIGKARAAEEQVFPRSGLAYFVDDDNGKTAARIADHYGVDTLLKGRLHASRATVPDETMWFFAWGHEYADVRSSPWPAGSVASFLKSNSFHSIREKTDEPCWVQGFLEQGVTATFGSVVEPYVQGFTRGDIFFHRFWSGEYTFAEAFAMSTPTLRWAMSAVGDPLYRLRLAAEEGSGQ